MEKSSRVSEIKSRINLSSVVGATVELKGRSPNFLGLCPFHKEKTPSFHVRDQIGRFKCFGCGASGDIFAFLMRLRGIGFSEAVLELAKRAGISHEGILGRGLVTDDKSSRDVLAAQEIAQEFFRDQLRNPSSMAWSYLQSERGLSEKMIEQAGLGFGGMAKDPFFAHLKRRNVSEAVALEAGLIKQGQFSLVPTFLSRITFPIRNVDGKIVAFGGRAFLKSENNAPKYVNTHSYSHYEKRKNFYGWYESKNAIQKGAVPILVEGYFDAMAMWALGLPALALCGTAITPRHAKILRAMSSKIILCFDTDNAGIQALRNSLVELSRVNIETSLIVLEEKDPGAYLEKKDLTSLKKRVSVPIDALCYLIDQAASHAQGNVVERMGQIDLLLPIFASIERPLFRRQYVMYLAKRLNEEPAILWADIERKMKSLPGSRMLAIEKAASPLPKLGDQERLLLEIALAKPGLVKEMTKVLASASTEIRKIIECLLALNNDEGLLDEQSIAQAVRSVNKDWWPAIEKVIRNRIEFSHEEALLSLKALEQKADQQVWKATIKKKRMELHDYEKKGDFAAVLSSLREKSSLLLSKKALKEVDERQQKPKQENHSTPRKLFAEARPKVHGIKDIGEEDSFFDAAEDWQ